MGTSGSYIQLKNRGFTREELQKGMSMLTADKRETTPRLERMKEGWLNSLDPALQGTFRRMMNQIGDKQPEAAFRADAEWIPLWVSRLCDGYILSSKDLKQLSELFQTPALGIALYDSDVLFVSYYDAAADTAFDCAKLPWEDFEEYDDQLYQTDLPRALTGLFPPERQKALQTFWEKEDEEKDAVDKMDELLALLGTDLIDPIAEHVPQGFEIVRPE